MSTRIQKPAPEAPPPAAEPAPRPFTAADVTTPPLLAQIKEVAPEAEVLHLDPDATYLVLLPRGTTAVEAQNLVRAMQIAGVKGALVRVNDPASVRLFKL